MRALTVITSVLKERGKGRIDSDKKRPRDQKVRD